MNLHRHRMYRKLLKVSDWLEEKNPFKMDERDHAARLDVIFKIIGIFKANKYFASIPSDMRGLRVYRTFLANYSSTYNIEKTKEIFKKMKAEAFSLTAYNYNQLLLLYKRLDKKNIQYVL